MLYWGIIDKLKYYIEYVQLMIWYTLWNDHNKPYLTQLSSHIITIFVFLLLRPHKTYSQWISSIYYLQLLSPVQLFETLWTVDHQDPLSIGFSRQEYWSGLPFPTPEDLPNPGNEPISLASPALAAVFFALHHREVLLFSEVFFIWPNIPFKTVLLRSPLFKNVLSLMPVNQEQKTNNQKTVVWLSKLFG